MLCVTLFNFHISPWPVTSGVGREGGAEGRSPPQSLFTSQNPTKFLVQVHALQPQVSRKLVLMALFSLYFRIFHRGSIPRDASRASACSSHPCPWGCDLHSFPQGQHGCFPLGKTLAHNHGWTCYLEGHSSK